MTPAEELHAAAEMVRSHAAAATESSGSTNWDAARHFPELPDSTFTSLSAIGGRQLLGGGGGRGRPPAYVHAQVGDYIALMDPSVGAALADWLDQTAEAFEGRDVPGAEPALAVARQILGRPDKSSDTHSCSNCEGTAPETCLTNDRSQP